MAFIKGTKIFTDSAWKNIEDISGHDKVLVRNFIGDAEFIQPFALKKSKYAGEIVNIGAKNWNFSVTPDHVIVYDRDETPIGAHFNTVSADEMTAHPNNRIYRKFKYLTPDDYKREKVSITDEFGKRWVMISNRDWFVLVGYTLCRGLLEKKKGGQYALQIFLDADKRIEEIKILSDILDRIGVVWSLIPSYTNDRWLIRVGGKNSLANKLANSLGSKKRKEMYLSDKIIYNTSKQDAQVLIETIINASKRAKTELGNEYQYVSSNEKLVDSLELLGTLSGYGMAKKLLFAAGTDTGITVVKNPVFSLAIRKPVKTYSPTYVNKTDYKGNVYKIDLFDGQVYVKNEGMPVWVNPK